MKESIERMPRNEQVECKSCSGRGYINGQKCPKCNGTGKK